RQESGRAVAPSRRERVPCRQSSEAPLEPLELAGESPPPHVSRARRTARSGGRELPRAGGDHGVVPVANLTEALLDGRVREPRDEPRLAHRASSAEAMNLADDLLRAAQRFLGRRN